MTKKSECGDECDVVALARMKNKNYKSILNIVDE